MTTKHYVDSTGNYLGGFQGDTGVVPAGAIEVPTSPAHGNDKWINGAWVPSPAPVPLTVTMRQARLALLQQGLLAQVETAVTNAGQVAQIEWEFSNTLERNKGLVLTIGAGLGLTSTQIDDLFKLAATL